jgi:glucose/arabinose dehydrogenase/PKD repeat protein
VALALGLVGLACAAAGAEAGTLPDGFQETVVFSGLSNPTAVRFSPDGRVFVAQKNGIVKVFDDLEDSTATIFANLSEEVYNFWDRGLLGLELDPDFPVEPYVYVLYARDALPGGSVPQWGTGTPNDSCPTPPGPTADGCVVTGRLSRLTASGDTMTAETPLITDWCQQYPSHSIGSLAFGPDGMLYASGGEGANFNSPDWGQFGDPTNPCGDPPGGVGGEMTLPTAEGGALRSQDVRTTADPAGLSGALLRIDPETGAGLADNPFGSSLDANAQRIVAYGLRNPFRFTFRPGTDEVWVGDVGQGTWEEIDRVTDPVDASADNFGWPCYEGGDGESARMPVWDALNVDLCESLYAPGDTGVVAPYYAYEHEEEVVEGESCEPGSSSITGLAFYSSGPFPNEYNGALFFTDQARDCLWAMLPGEDGLPDPAQIETFDPGAPSAVDLQVGPEGSLYFADLDDGQIRRIAHADGNQAPVADAEADPENGAGPLLVQFDASNSSDPDGDPLEYAWDLDDDGEFNDSTEASPSYEYVDSGVHVATVRVSDPDGASDTDSVSIQVDNTPPTATIETPLSSLEWAVGDQIDFSASATDDQDGELPESAFEWEIVLNHCPSNCHPHVIEEEIVGASGEFVAPDHEYPSSLTLTVTVTDSGGLSDTESVTIEPRTVDLTLQTAPAGLSLNLNDEQLTAPVERTVIEGSLNSLTAPSPQTLDGTSYSFASWSDGGAATHEFVAEEDRTLTATFTTAPSAPTIVAVDPVGPANDNDPEVSGTVGGGSPSAVKIYAKSACSGTVVATGTPAEFAAGLTVHVPGDATTTFSARAANLAGDSACSNDASYTEDSTPPGAPSGLAVAPAGPANDNDPEVRGTAGGGSPTAIEIYADAGCAGTVVATGTPAEFAGGGITVHVAGDVTTTFSARDVDPAGNESACSGGVSFVEDSTAPGAPDLQVIAPAGPANDNDPQVKGTAGGGSPSLVKLYMGPGCSGAVAETGTPSQLAAGIVVHVPGDATTMISARSADVAGNESTCSNDVPYVEDSTPPTAPTVLATDPASPASDNNPRVRGAVGSGSPIKLILYSGPGCTGPRVTRPVSNFTGAGIVQAVPANTVTAFSARAADAAGNESACSNDLAYTEDSKAPNTAIVKGPSGKLRPPRRGGKGAPRLKVRFSFRSSEPGATFLCKFDDGRFASCRSPRRYRGLRPGPHHFYVRSVDAAGNVDPTPAVRHLEVPAKGGRKRDGGRGGR